MDTPTRTTSSDPDVKTFRGRSLEELLPRIRAELGPDAIVLRRREGLAGGVGGFFQRPYVEVDARAPQADERPLEIRSDRATAEGLSSPAIQALVEQATPFADALAAAMPEAERREAPQVSAGLYGPQPNAAAIAAAAREEEAKEEPSAPAVEEPATPAPIVAPAAEEPVAPAPAAEPPAAPVAPQRTAAADSAEKRLVFAGLSPALAADVVGEAVNHGLPFASVRSLKKLVRGALARRVPVLAELGPGRRTIAFVGAGGAGKTSAVAHAAAAYAAAGADVVVIALRVPADAGRLEPHGVSVIAGATAEEARKRLGRRRPLITLIDTPPLSRIETPAAIRAVAADLQALKATEVHLALPATLSPAAAEEIAAALAPLGLTHIALTHADETARPGAPVELAITSRKPLSYVCAREGVEPADAAELAQQLLP